MNKDDWFSVESCKAKAREDLDRMEEHSKERRMTLREVTPFDLDQRTQLILAARKAYPRGAKVSFDDDYGYTNNGVPTRATGTVSEVMIMPNGRREIGICCERWKGVEILTVWKREKDITQVVRLE